MSSPADSDLVAISPPTPHTSLPDSKDALVAHIERSGALEMDIKPIVHGAGGDDDAAHVKQARETGNQDGKKSVPTSEEDVRRRMEETVQNIRERADRLQAAAQPYAERTRTFAETQPVLFTFLVIFGLFSAIPLLCFGTFLLGASLFVLTVAAVGICVSLFFAILLAATILIPVLFITFLLSTGALTFLVFLFLSHRLYLHVSAACTVDPPVHSDGAHDGDEQDRRAPAREYTYDRIATGMLSWTDETKARVLPARYLVVIPAPASSRIGEGQTEEDEDGGGSEMTLVGEVTGVKMEQGDKGGKKVRWSVSHGSDVKGGNGVGA